MGPDSPGYAHSVHNPSGFGRYTLGGYSLG